MKALLEKDIQRAVCEWLELRKFFFWRQNNMPIFSEGKFRALPKYTPRGIPDIICLAFGSFIALEIKRPGKRPTPDQKKFGEKVFANGGYYYVITSVDQILNIPEFTRPTKIISEKILDENYKESVAE